MNLNAIASNRSSHLRGHSSDSRIAGDTICISYQAPPSKLTGTSAGSPPFLALDPRYHLRLNALGEGWGTRAWTFQSKSNSLGPARRRLWSRWRRVGIGNAQGIRPAKNNSAAFRVCKGTVSLFKLEKEIQCLGGKEKVGRKSDGMNRIWHRTCRYVRCDEPAVIADLPLVVADYSELE